VTSIGIAWLAEASPYLSHSLALHAHRNSFHCP